MPDPVYNAPAWVSDAVFYQIFPERFCNGDPSNDPQDVCNWNNLPNRDNFFGGDLQGIWNKLDYLQDLGVNALYLTPIFRARTNHKYDTADYFQVDPAFGTNDLLKQFVKELHRRGMRIVLDGVFNHCGQEFPAFQDVLKHGAASPYADWFFARSYPLTPQPLNYLSCGGCTYLPKLNLRNPAVREHVLKVARFWLEEAQTDGWRLDVPFKIDPEFWQQFRQTVKSINPEAYLVGEIWREAGPWVRGDTFDGVTNYRLRDLILDYTATQILDGEDFGFETGMLLQSHGPAAGSMWNLLGSHDTTRIYTLLKGDVDLLRIAFTAIFTTPGAPLVYYGDEIGLPGETDPGCRRPMPWNEDQWNAPLRKVMKTLIQARKSHPALRRGERRSLAYFNGLFAYRQFTAGDEAIVLLNPRESIHDLRVPTGSPTRRWKDVFTSQILEAADGTLTFPDFPACSTMLFVPEK